MGVDHMNSLSTPRGLGESPVAEPRFSPNGDMAKIRSATRRGPTPKENPISLDWVGSLLHPTV